MRILFLTQYFAPEVGAPQVRLAAMVRELSRAGHTVEVVTAMPNHPGGEIHREYRGRFYRRDFWEGVPVHRVWLYAATGAGLKRMASYASFTLTSLVGLMKARKPDVVFVESPPLFLGVPAWIASRVWGVPFVFNVADLWPDSVREMGVMKDGWILRFAERLEAWTYRKAAFVNAVTEGIRTDLLTKKGLPPGKVLFLPNGVDTNLFRPMPPDEALARELGLEPGQRLVLYAGTIGYAQGLDVVLDAMVLLRDRPELRFAFVGSGPEVPRLQARARELGLASVHFLPACPVEHVSRLYTLAYAGFASLKGLPLFEGARPSKLFPIMASGKPVLYSGSGEGARLVSEAGAGLVTPPEDPAALAGALRALLSDPEAAARMGRRGRAFVEQNLRWPALIGAWLHQLQGAKP